MFVVFLIRSIIQLIAEIFMSKGYFPHNVFERVDTCNRTTIYFKEDRVKTNSEKHRSIYLFSYLIANYLLF